MAARIMAKLVLALGAAALACAPARVETEPERVLTLASSLGIELLHVEQRVGDAWLRAEHVAAGMRVDAAATHVRAAGHVERALERGVDALELEPGAALVVEADGLEDALVSVSANYGDATLFAPGGALAWGFDADGRWHVAVAPGRVDAPSGMAHAYLELRGGIVLVAHLRAEEGVRGALATEVPALAPLELLVHDGLDGLGWGTIDVDVKLPERLEGIRAMRWGEWSFSSTRPGAVRVNANAAQASLVDVPLGARVDMLVHGIVGRRPLTRTIEHDGEPWHVHFAYPDLQLTVASSIEPRPPALDVHVETALERWKWRLSDTGPAPFERALTFGDVTRTAGRPAAWGVELSFGLGCGSEQCTRWNELIVVPFDSGDHAVSIDSDRARPDVVLAPGHGLTASPLWCAIRAAGGEWVPDRIVEWSVPGADGSLALYVHRGDVDGRFVLLRHAGETLWFERGPDGRCARIETATYRVALAVDALPADAAGIHVGWHTQGEEQLLRFVAAQDVPLERELVFDAPPGGVELWWARGSRRVADPAALRPGEGSVALASTSETVRVP